jgi:hypothetical protein
MREKSKFREFYKSVDSTDIDGSRCKVDISPPGKWPNRSESSAEE